jgi:serine/threonine protein kinase
MPIAEGGDLSSPGRLALYKNDIDAVLQVAKQVAGALSFAHAKGMIHRDVKPQNILFTGMGHEVWLTDFGICLIREQARVTETPEVVGPRAFLAPELEEGGQLDVTPAADIYSLGKVIYYAVSGGTIVPRERIHEEKYRQIFAAGEQYHLLELLLRRMVCLVPERIQDMNSALRELEKIESWKHNAKLVAISDEGRAAIEKLQRRSIETARINAENKSARQQEAETLAKVRESILEWLEAELLKIAATINSPTVKAEVRKIRLPDGQPLRVETGHFSGYSTLDGVELVVQDVGASTGKVHALQFYFCDHLSTVISHKTNVGPAPEPARALEIGILTYYKQRLNHLPPGAMTAGGYLTKKKTIGTPRQFVDIPGLTRPPKGARRLGGTEMIRSIRFDPTMASFNKDFSLHLHFKTSGWPANEAQLRDMVTEAVGTFVTIIESGR